MQFFVIGERYAIALSGDGRIELRDILIKTL